MNKRSSYIKKSELRLTKEQLRKLQLTQLELLIEVDRICRKYNIKYSLACGTLLGAVRHNGFIPWDDDIDVWMMRKEYEKFCRACKRELSSKYFLQNWFTDPNFNSAYGKLRKRGTSFVRIGQEKMKYVDGIYIDILPLDIMPNKYWDRVFMGVGAWIFRKLTYAKAGAMCEKKLIHRIKYRILSLIPLRITKRAFQKLITKYKNEDYLYCKCLGDTYFTPHWRDNFEDLIEWEFEGHKFFIPKNYDDVLKISISRDYMTLPPVEQRKPHANVSYIDFGDDN
jgi:lipopolysaccharide cholinephosphotransferase